MNLFGVCDGHGLNGHIVSGILKIDLLVLEIFLKYII